MNTNRGLRKSHIMAVVVCLFLVYCAWVTMPKFDEMKADSLNKRLALEWLFRFAVFCPVCTICAAICVAIGFVNRVLEHRSNGGVLPPSKNANLDVMITFGLGFPTVLVIFVLIITRSPSLLGTVWISTAAIIASLGWFCSTPHWVRFLNSYGLLLPRGGLTGMPESEGIWFPSGIHRVSFAQLRAAKPEITRLLFDLWLLCGILRQHGCRYIWIVFHRSPAGVIVIEGCYQTSGCADLRVAIGKTSEFELFPNPDGKNIRTLDESISLYPDDLYAASMDNKPWRSFDRGLLARMNSPGYHVLNFLQRVNSRFKDSYSLVGILQIELPDYVPPAPLEQTQPA